MNEVAPKKPLITKIILGILGIVIGVAVVQMLLPRAKKTEQTLTTEEVLKKIVDNLKVERALPHKFDEITTLIAIHADTQNMAIVYDMEISDATVKDEAGFSNALKTNVLKLCENSADTFKQGIHYQWNYHVIDDDKKIAITLKKEDCDGKPS